MELTKLINSVHAIQVAGEVERKDISTICCDSRAITKGCVFVAIKGLASDGHDFVLDAISKGATVVVLDKNCFPEEIFLHRNVTKILVVNSRIALAELSHSFYKEPSNRLALIGITGTNGKTTTAWLIQHILRFANHKTGLMGTIANYIDEEVIPSKLTTPESNDLCELLYDMVRKDCSHAVMEVSSHSLALDRVYGLNYKTAIFTNLTIDHLDFHGSIENYRDAKKKLFDNLKETSSAIVNIDDSNWNEIVKDTKAKVYTYGTSEDADFRIENLRCELSGSEFSIRHNEEFYSIQVSLSGAFNASNITAAFAACLLEGIDAVVIIEALKVTRQTPGRFEMYTENEKSVIVDYAHTPDSLEKTLNNIKEIVKDTRPIITVFGCGGNRDKSKRPMMGKIASELSSEVIVTSDNPRNEDAEQIISEIVKGIENSNFKIIVNRREAIAEAVTSSPANAVILIAGKGHEDYQIIGNEKTHFSDKEEALSHLRENVVI